MAQTPNIKELMEGERTRLTARKGELEKELTDIITELEAVERYLSPVPPAKLSRSTTPRPLTGRSERGYVQSAVLKIITEHPQGLKKNEIVRLLRPEGIADSSISNTLPALIEMKKITHEGRGGKYHPADPSVPTAPDQPSS